MKVICEGIINGEILDKYGKRGREKKFGMPTLSLPIKIEDYPKNTKSFALIFDDPDSVKVCGFVWIHWLAIFTKNTLKEGDSLNSFDLIQGYNSWNENCYGGPCPPDRPHNYRLKVFALKDNLNLRGNFTLNQLEKAMNKKIINQCEIFGLYKN